MYLQWNSANEIKNNVHTHTHTQKHYRYRANTPNLSFFLSFAQSFFVSFFSFPLSLSPCQRKKFTKQNKQLNKHSTWKCLRFSKYALAGSIWFVCMLICLLAWLIGCRVFSERIQIDMSFAMNGSDCVNRKCSNSSSTHKVLAISTPHSISNLVQTTVWSYSFSRNYFTVLTVTVTYTESNVCLQCVLKCSHATFSKLCI